MTNNIIGDWSNKLWSLLEMKYYEAIINKVKNT